MLQSRNLDDQPFEELVRAAVGRLPWLCPEWTDHNAHDPGVTLIELFAWYKEMQQYHMNRFTDAMKKKLLKLVGVTPRPEKAAACFVELPEDSGAAYPALSRLETPEGIPFELTEAVPAGRPALAACLIARDGAVTDVLELMKNPGIALQPFEFGSNGPSELWLGFDAAPEGTLALWFDVEEELTAVRNPFASPDQAPREIGWEFAGCGEALPLSDETHAMSADGYIRFDVPKEWARTPGPGPNAPELRWLRAWQRYAGCEESVRLMGLSASRYRAAQRETRAKLTAFAAPPQKRYRFEFADAFEQEAAFAVFVRGETGWAQDTGFTVQKNGRALTVNTAEAAQDGEENLRVVCLDPVHYTDMFLDSDGRPCMSLPLVAAGYQALKKSLALICDTVCPDGATRPELWRCVDDLNECAAGDRAFTYDPAAGLISFGDGRHGAVVPKGKAAILIASLELSLCAGGNVPENSGLRFCADGRPVYNAPASGGRDAETAASAARRFLKMLGATNKCASAEDYERAARSAPGLRVAAAKALVGFDPAESFGRTSRPVVTVVVIPYSRRPLPLPDGRFLEAVRAHLENLRPVCTVLKVIPPRYVGVGVSLRVKLAGRDARERVEAAVKGYFALGARSVGDPVVKNDLAALVTALPEVTKLTRLELRALGPDCYLTNAGDITVPRDGVAYLKSFEADSM